LGDSNFNKLLKKEYMSRILYDHYPTPDWMTESLVKHANIQGSILECCAGKDRAIATVLEGEKGIKRVWTNDFYYGVNCDFDRDAALVHSWEYSFPRDIDWVITNPPFNNYLPILKNAMAYAKIGVAMLLRVTADEMVMSDRDRYNWWAENPESLVIKMPRYCFAKSSKHDKFSTDSAYCQWFVWRKDGYRYPQSIIRLPHDRISGFTRQPDLKPNRQLPLREY
jgi:hypothetical protein